MKPKFCMFKPYPTYQQEHLRLFMRNIFDSAYRDRMIESLAPKALLIGPVKYGEVIGMGVALSFRDTVDGSNAVGVVLWQNLYVVVSGLMDETSSQILVKDSVKDVFHFELLAVLGGFRGIKDSNAMPFCLTPPDSSTKTILFGQAQ